MWRQMCKWTCISPLRVCFFWLSLLVWFCKKLIHSCPCSIAPSPCFLIYHFFSVAFYAIWIMFTDDRTIPSSQNGSRCYSNGNANPRSTTPRFDEYPALLIKSVRVVHFSIFLRLWTLFPPWIFSFLVLDSLCCVWSAILDGNMLVVGFEFTQVE